MFSVFFSVFLLNCSKQVFEFYAYWCFLVVFRAAHGNVSCRNESLFRKDSFQWYSCATCLLVKCMLDRQDCCVSHFIRTSLGNVAFTYEQRRDVMDVLICESSGPRGNDSCSDIIASLVPTQRKRRQQWSSGERNSSRNPKDYKTQKTLPSPLT